MVDLSEEDRIIRKRLLQKVHVVEQDKREIVKRSPLRPGAKLMEPLERPGVEKPLVPKLAPEK